MSFFASPIICQLSPTGQLHVPGQACADGTEVLDVRLGKDVEELGSTWGGSVCLSLRGCAAVEVAADGSDGDGWLGARRLRFRAG